MNINFITHVDNFIEVNTEDIIITTNMAKKLKEHNLLSDANYQKIKNYIAKVNDENKKLAEDKEKYFAALMQLESPKHIIVIQQRLVNNKIWDDVAEFMELSKTQVQRIYSDAIKCFEPILSNI